MCWSCFIVKSQTFQDICKSCPKPACFPFSDQSGVTGSSLDRYNQANRQSPTKAFISVLPSAVQAFTCSGLALFHSLNQRLASWLVSVTTRSIMAGVMKKPNRVTMSSIGNVRCLSDDILYTTSFIPHVQSLLDLVEGAPMSLIHQQHDHLPDHRLACYDVHAHALWLDQVQGLREVISILDIRSWFGRFDIRLFCDVIAFSI